MTADSTGLTGDEMLRKAREFDDYTFLYVRRNGAGRLVRDAQFVDDCPDLATATTLFATGVYNTDVAVCGVLRGHVRTVDNFEYASGPDLSDPRYRQLLNNYNEWATDHVRYTVVCSWDTGDGRKRYSRRVHAVNAEHAELIVLDELTEGEVLIAGVVNGHPILEDRDLTWATISGEPADTSAADTGDTSMPTRTVVLAVAAVVAMLIIMAVLIGPHL
jgi:hypothetical protein